MYKWERRAAAAAAALKCVFENACAFASLYADSDISAIARSRRNHCVCCVAAADFSADYPCSIPKCAQLASDVRFGICFNANEEGAAKCMRECARCGSFNVNDVQYA